jgi:hypothetical protein
MHCICYPLYFSVQLILHVTKDQILDVTDSMIPHQYESLVYIARTVNKFHMFPTLYVLRHRDREEVNLKSVASNSFYYRFRLHLNAE